MLKFSLTGEDSAEMSAAGQMETILGVKGIQQVFTDCYRQCLIKYAYPEHCNLLWQSETIISLSLLIVYYSYLIV